jgi:single-stranded DNA-specific DHH superfamily exonuclease
MQLTYKNKEKRAAYMNAWREANKERRAATDKTWYEANKERKAATDKAYGVKLTRKESSL